MKRTDAEQLVIAAAKQVAETLPENYPFDRQYVQVLTDRVARLRKAIRDLEHALDDEEMETDERDTRGVQEARAE